MSYSRKESIIIRKPFATSIDVEVASNFKLACETYGIKMNNLLELFMDSFAKGEFELRLIKKNSFSIEERKK